MSKIRPLEDRVVIQQIAVEEKTAGGIVLPDTAREKPQRGKVIAVGPGKLLDSGERAAMGAVTGDQVLFGKYSGTEIKVDGEEIKILRESDILAVGSGNLLEERLVEPSDSPTLVSAESHVVTGAARQMNSPESLASVRRQTSATIKDMLASLEKRARRDDFEVFALMLVEEIHELLGRLAEVPREGNTREILRQVRDTFLDGGSERYRDATARDLVATIFERLAQADKVTPDDVDQVWDELCDGGLAAPIPALFQVDEAKEGADA